MTKISDAEAAKIWRIIKPGVLGMPSTQVTIHFIPDGCVAPYQVRWQGNDNVPGGLHRSLTAAKTGAEQFIADLLEMGLEP